MNYKTNLFKITFICLLLFFSSQYSIACDTSPTISTSSTSDNGDGTFDIDLTVCIGDTGSEDGFDLSLSGGVNITATSSASITNGGRTANASIGGGTLSYTYPGFPGTWFEPDPSANPCFSFTITVDGDPAGQTIDGTGLNDGTSCSVGATVSWSSPIIPGPPPPPPVCGDNFFDSGGSMGTYANNELTTTIICPTVPGDNVTVTFSSFSLESGFDDLTIYDNNTASGGSTVYTGTTSPGTITATNPTGCLTFVFDSDGSIVRDGWEATVNCTTLPLEMLNFNAKHSLPTKSNIIDWEVIIDNPSTITLQKGIFIEGKLNWVDLESYSVKNSNIKNAYEDKNLKNSESSYRLLLVDAIGNRNYSNTINITNTNFGNSYEIHPNPARDVINISSIDLPGNKINIYNNIGALVYSKNVDIDVLKENIDVSNLNNGIYFIELSGSVNKIQKINIHH